MSAKIAKSEGLWRFGVVITDDMFDFNREWPLENDDHGDGDADADADDDDDYIHEGVSTKNSTLLSNQATVIKILISTGAAQERNRKKAPKKQIMSSRLPHCIIYPHAFAKNLCGLCTAYPTSPIITFPFFSDCRSEPSARQSLSALPRPTPT